MSSDLTATEKVRKSEDEYDIKIYQEYLANKEYKEARCYRPL